jgi:hypothetical protein
MATHAAEAEKYARNQANLGGAPGALPRDMAPGAATMSELQAFSAVGVGCLSCLGAIVGVVVHLGKPNFEKALAIGGVLILYGALRLYLGIRYFLGW